MSDSRSTTAGQAIFDRTEDDTGKLDLVLEGGGVKGVALVGAVNWLREHGYPEVQRVAGTSAGAIAAALIAAKMSPEHMKKVIRDMLRLPWDYRELCDCDPDDIPVADAVTASAAIPFFFRTRTMRCGPH